MGRPKLSDHPCYAAAVHEAGHAIVSTVVGHRVSEIVVKPNRKGWTIHHAFHIDEDGRRHFKIDPLRLGMIIAAGDAAEVLWLGMAKNEATRGDDRALVTLGFTGRSFPTLRMHATAILKENKAKHSRLVRALLKNNRLVEKKLRELL